MQSAASALKSPGKFIKFQRPYKSCTVLSFGQLSALSPQSQINVHRQVSVAAQAMSQIDLEPFDNLSRSEKANGSEKCLTWQHLVGYVTVSDFMILQQCDQIIQCKLEGLCKYTSLISF